MNAQPALIQVIKGRDTLERLACRLHEVMERLDPTEAPSWKLLSEIDKEFYRQCAKAVAVELAEILTLR
jgi:hypothetical protein